MKGLESGKDKIQKICDALRKETLEPAKQEAREVIENAHLKASEILEEARNEAKSRLQQVEKELEERKNLFQSSFQLACRQGIERFKQRIEEELFQRELDHLVQEQMADPKMIAHILDAFFRALESKGIEEEFSATIPQTISSRSIVSLLAARTLERLKQKDFQLGDFAGGVQIQLKGRHITIDISDRVVRELIANYIRRDLRDLIFNS